MIIDFNKNNAGGYEEGYADGQDSIISTFSSTTATVNGDYGSSAHPLSSITVNVAQTGHTDQELQEAYSSGYTSGETHQKSLLSTTAITENGSFSAENGYSAITVNVPQGGGSEDFAKLIDKSITNAVIPNGVTKIGEDIFSNCTSLSSVTIPNSVTSIEGSAFNYCTSLSSVTIPSIIEIGQFAFSYCSRLSDVTIQNGVKIIGVSSFLLCKSLSSITIPNSVQTINNSSFNSCSALTEVNIGSGVTKIGTQAFKDCSTLTVINISATTVPTISSNTFQGVPSTGTVHYPQGSDYSSWQSNTYLSGWTFVDDIVI